jgi:hypothetical protein
MASAKLEIVNNALVELGDTILSSLSENRLAVAVANQVYDDVYEDLLAKAPWRFAVQKSDLSRLVELPLNEWAYQYELPELCLSIIRTYPMTRYEIFGTRIYSNSSSLSVDYIKKVSETNLTPPFVRLLSLELAVRMCMAITNDVDLKTRLQGDARMQFAAAMAVDAQQRPNVTIQSSPFVDVRY